MLDSDHLGSIGSYLGLKKMMLQLAKLQTYLLHFHREVNITNIPIFLPDVIPVYESHVLSEEKNILNRCLFHSISFKGKEKFSI